MLQRLFEWYERLKPPIRRWIVGGLIALVFLSSIGRESDRRKQIMKVTSEKVAELESQMRDELRMSSELHGRILQRLEQIESDIQELQKRDR